MELYVTSLAHRISRRNRKKKWDFFSRVFHPGPQDSVLDVGFSENEYSAVDNYIEKFYPYPKNLTALGVEAPVQIATRYPEVRFQQYDGQHMPFGDKHFDIGWSNAVVEHVGDYDKQVQFVKELTRVSKSFFFTTPNFHFPVEVHTRTPLLHLFGKRVFDPYLRLIGKEWATGDYMYLLSKEKLQRILVDAGVAEWTIIPNRLCGFVLDFWVYSTGARPNR